MNITYTPVFRESYNDESEGSDFDIMGYQPRYTQTRIEDKPVTVTKSAEPKLTTTVVPTINTVVQHTDIKKFGSKKEFIDTMMPIYRDLLIKKGLDPAYAKSLVAQDGLETNWGKSAQGKFNYGNITLGSNKSRSYTKGKDTDGKGNPITQKFVNYDSIEDYVNAKIALLNNKRYNAFTGPLSNFASRVHKGGYATNPKYTEILNSVIATAKHGGILKGQYGAALDETE